MSEHQYVAFRAVDAPVSQKNLAYMRRQSTRAEITPWRFDNEYHYGDFRGDAQEMLRRGYDLYFHYANFGIRSLSIRLPRGLPDPRAAKPYLGESGLGYLKDKTGPGGTLAVEPSHEPGGLDELWDFESLIDRLIPLRAEILAGDLRPLYLAHLAVCRDDNHDPEDTTEGPVPAGLAELTDAQQALAELYELKEPLLAAAAEESPPLPPREDQSSRLIAWLARQSDAAKTGWLAELLGDDQAAVRAEVLAKFRTSDSAPAWPTAPGERTISQLEEAAAQRRRVAEQQAAAKAKLKRRKRLASIVADPQPALRKADDLVARRQTAAYEQAAELLAEVRDALAPDGRADVADGYAEKLRAKHPTARGLVAALRRHGFLSK